MAKVLAFFAEGTEEIECLTVVDILRRGSVDVELISITENKTLVGSHKITVVCAFGAKSKIACRNKSA